MVNKRLKRLGVIAWAVYVGEQEGINTGHTLLQKLIYLLQEGKGIDLDYKYKMYYYGPYCENVWADLNYLEDVKAITIEANPTGFGYRIYPKNAIESLLDFADNETGKKVSELLQFLGHRPVRELECLATALYVYKELSGAHNRELLEIVVKRVRTLKPHLSSKEVEDAINVLKEYGLL